ncbi:MAG: hypothetical protein R2716_03545 [Microthrixaceae bacterium]
MRDKDGIAAAAAASAMVGSCSTAVRACGTCSTTWPCATGPTSRATARWGPLRGPAADPAGRSWSRWQRTHRGGSPPLEVVSNDRPARDVLRIHLEDETRVVLRPSGTEAKLKYYCEAIEPVRDLDCEQARARASLRLESVVPALVGLLSR